MMSETSLNIIAARGTLKISYHPTIGQGVWRLFLGTDRHQDAEQPEKLASGSFEMHLDGSITLDGDTIEMDFAAIRLIAALTSAASRERIGVPA